MKKSLILIWAVLAAALLLGCAGHTQYEYRYRVFYGAELPQKENPSPEEFSRMFYPLGSLNRALDLFGEEGFVLYNYKPLEQGRNYIFEFRRPITSEQAKSLRGRQTYGIYQIEKKDKPLLVAVIPSQDGIEVIELDGVKNRYQATMEAREIIYNTPEGQVSLSFTTEGGVEQKVKTVYGDTSSTKNFKGKKLEK